MTHLNLSHWVALWWPRIMSDAHSWGYSTNDFQGIIDVETGTTRTTTIIQGILDGMRWSMMTSCIESPDRRLSAEHCPWKGLIPILLHSPVKLFVLFLLCVSGRRFNSGATLWSFHVSVGNLDTGISSYCLLNFGNDYVGITSMYPLKRLCTRLLI